MADSKRLTVLKRLTSFLATEVSIANGYKHDLANAVFRGRYKFSEGDPDTMVSILENLDPDRFPRRVGDDDGYEAPMQRDDFLLLIQGWAVDDPANPTDNLYELMADVKKALAKILQGPHPVTGAGAHPDHLLGDLITGMTIEPGTVRPFVEQASDTCCFYLRVVLKFVEDLKDPYKLD